MNNLRKCVVFINNKIFSDRYIVNDKIIMVNMNIKDFYNNNYLK